MARTAIQILLALFVMATSLFLMTTTLGAWSPGAFEPTMWEWIVGCMQGATALLCGWSIVLTVRTHALREENRRVRERMLSDRFEDGVFLDFGSRVGNRPGARWH